jgi:hypothetical protein
MFKEILSAWIFYQLVILGFIFGSIHNEIIQNKYECPKEEYLGIEYVIFSTAFPLAYFIPENFYTEEVDSYCNN